MGEPMTFDDDALDRAVRNLTARYCDAVARFDMELFASLWADDADWVVGSGAPTSGRDRIARVFGRLRGDYGLCTQELMSGYVTPDAATTSASARWQIREYQWKADAPVNCVMGIYSDQLAVREGRCLFVRRRFDVLYRGPVDLTGAITPPDVID